MSTHKVKAAVAVSIVSAIMACSVCDPITAGAWTGDSYKSWQQQDPAWCSMKLGPSSYTVGNSGCVITAAAMLMIKSGSVTDPGFTPAKLVQYFNTNGGFGDTGNLDLKRLSRYAPSFRYCQPYTLSGTKEQKAAQMQHLMEEGYYLMAVVKNGAHYVAIDSVSGSRVIMMDPGSQTTNLFVQYATGGVTELRLFRGANSRSESMEEELAVTPPAPTDLTPAAAPAETMEAPAYEELTPETPSYDDLTPETPPAPQETAPETTQPPTEVIVAAPAVIDIKATETKINASEPEKETTPAEETPETPPMPEDPEETEEEADNPPTPPMPADEPQEMPDSSRILFRLNGQELLMKVCLTAARDLVLYAAPNQKADHLLVIPAGGELEIVEADGGFRWGKAAYAGKTGWIDLNAAGL